MTVELPFMQPRPILWTPEEAAIWDAYEAEHSLAVYPDGTDVEPPLELRARVLDITARLPQLPPHEAEDGPDIDCLCCNDTGFFSAGAFSVDIPCTDCPRGDWTWRHELFADMDGEDR